MRLFVIVVAGLFSICFTAKYVNALDLTQRTVCGTNAGNEIWCTTYAGMEKGQWERIPGSLKQIVIRDGHFWGVNASGEIFYGTDVKNKTSWVHLQGSAKEVSENHGVLCIVNNGDEVWCADKGITTTQPDWHKAPGKSTKLNYVSIN